MDFDIMTGFWQIVGISIRGQKAGGSDWEHECPCSDEDNNKSQGSFGH